LGTPLSSVRPIDKNFPFVLKIVLQDQMGAILSIDSNEVLDLYASASSDGTIAIRCLRTAKLWKVIKNDKLMDKHV